MNSYLRYLTIVLVLSLFPLYVLAVNSLPSGISASDCGSARASGKQVGFCTTVSATVVRDYYFGLVEMKTTVLGINVDALNNTMGAITLFLAALSLKYLKKA